VRTHLPRLDLYRPPIRRLSEVSGAGGRVVPLRAEVGDIVRTMFALYSLLIVAGVIFFVTVGLTQQ
jgi:hypothetical protein